MSTLGNILWFIFGGFLAGMGYILAGLLISLTIIGIPFGLQAIKLGIAMFCPFGKRIVTLPDADSPLRVIFNLIWLVVASWGIAVIHLVPRRRGFDRSPSVAKVTTLARAAVRCSAPVLGFCG